jgi:hypothetical protein
MAYELTERRKVIINILKIRWRINFLPVTKNPNKSIK